MSSKNQQSPAKVPKVLYENRYCNQEDFSILVCGGIDEDYECINPVFKFKISSFEGTDFPSMEKPHHSLKIATIKSDIFAFEDNFSKERNKSNYASVEIYSDKTKT